MPRHQFTAENITKGLETRRRNAQLRAEGKLPPRKKPPKAPAADLDEDEAAAIVEAAAAAAGAADPPIPMEPRKVRARAVDEETELLRWLAYQDGVLYGVVALLDEEIGRVASSGYTVPSVLRRAHELLKELL